MPRPFSAYPFSSCPELLVFTLILTINNGISQEHDFRVNGRIVTFLEGIASRVNTRSQVLYSPGTLDRTYRYMTKEPMYPFGFDLSYASLEYSHIHLSSDAVKKGSSETQLPSKSHSV